ncbi:MAG: helix-turn-helix domain-containing protein [Pseudomonas sp.]
MTSNTLPAPGDLLDEKEAAALLAMKVATLRNWRALRTGPRYVKVGKRAVRYRRADLEAFIAGGAA